ncbi:uncharacterized protein B0I36DRAFT_386561 [Microdochium trichocladiopsis]|uniref:ATP phosphoribosyltransferase n=1 Tax=Microdochium trichocladiopsis TaxID=1682393 RepID=A0A9P9BMG8_9PEZI|nr:uncharacterized protein B0I36DRAFT_386561 [Microdochium trichocladiopsis]KAH7026263.1 hypothetical protein B0I36DRAFT_386561 [Microdochium trichocladiopsis]
MASSAAAMTLYRLVFFVPESHLAACKTAVFAAGAGRYPDSNYTECCWTTDGTGQFRPGAAANPHLGAVGQLEHVREVRVETPCLGKEVARKAVEALKTSQKAFDLYQSGDKVWRKEDLADIERQLEDASAVSAFTLRRIDGTTLKVKNPMFGVENPIWEPIVRYREYWALVDCRPKEPAETYNCSYVIEWRNASERLYRGPHQGSEALFHSWRDKWNTSATCAALRGCITNLAVSSLLPPAKFEGMINPIKILCFGLGDLNFKGPNWWYIQNRQRPIDEQETDISVIENPLVHHAIALTIRETVQDVMTSNQAIIQRQPDTRLLTQDPQYTPETISLLARAAPEFEVVGSRGASGFAELDHGCIVFAPFVNAPLNQIIADLARPLAIITPAFGKDIIFDQRGRPCGNPESPRSREMWKEYDVQDFPLVEAEKDVVKGNLWQLKIYTRR